MPRNLARPGANLVEVLIAASIAGVVMLALGAFIGSSYKASGTERDHAYAMQKAMQILEEVSAHYSKSPTDTGPDKFADGPHFELTVAAGATPGDPISGNPYVTAKGKYKYVREVISEPVTGDPFARKVTVKVWYNEATAPTVPTKAPLAVVANVMRSNVGAIGPKHVVDVYILSLENVPHLINKDDTHQFYPSAAAARAAFNGALTTFQGQFPGYEFRKHYITRMSMGRETKYKPYINDEKDIHATANQDGLNWAYFYPGRLDGSGSKYFDLADINGKYLRGAPASSPVPQNDANYALADQFNHAVRYGEEHPAPASTNAPGAFASPSFPPGASDGTGDVSQLSYRQFLEDMLRDTTGKYANAILVNLHGDLMPIIPLRAYSDAARDSDSTYQESHDSNRVWANKRRIVTHPYKLVTQAGGVEPLRLLTHGYMSDGKPQIGVDFYPTPNTSYKTWQTQADWWHSHGSPIDNSGWWLGEAKIIVKDIKPYVKDSTLNDLNLTDGDPEDVTISAVQVQKINPGNGQDNTRYNKHVQWPTDGDSAGSTAEHGGPHIIGHPGNNDHHGGVGDGTNHALANPTFMDADGDGDANDLVVNVGDMPFDARKVTDGGSIYGFDHTDPETLLHGLQYFPDPLLPFLDQPSGGTRPRNTARVIIEMNLTAAAAGKKFEVETMLRKGVTYSSAGTWPTSGSNDPAISRTWAYAGNASDWSSTLGLYGGIPLTDQITVVGDPRHNPYNDLRVRGDLLNNFWSDLRSPKEIYKDVTNDSSTDAMKFAGGYNPYAVGDIAAMGTAPLGQINTAFDRTGDSWNNTKINAPLFYRVLRLALIRNSMIFVNPTGAPARYLGLGGEFSLEGEVNGLDVKMAKRPYDGGTGTDAGAEADELFRDNTRFIERASGDKWFNRSWIGEIYPEDVYQGSWKTRGNIPVAAATPNDFRRVTIDQVDNFGPFSDQTKANNKKLAGMKSFASLLNAATSGSAVEVVAGGAGDKAAQTQAGKDWSTSLGVTLIGSDKTPYAIKPDGAPTPAEWATGFNLYAADRTTIDWLVTASAAPRAYYNHKDAGDNAVSPLYIRFASPPTVPQQTAMPAAAQAVILANTMVPENPAEAPGVFSAAIASSLQAFLDGSRAGLGRYNIKVSPRVKLTEPTKSASLNGNSVALKWYAKWIRPDGKDYSPLFATTAGYPPNPASGEPVDTRYFVKYRLLPSGPWRTAKLTAPVASADAACATGEPVSGGGVVPVPNQNFPTPITATWDTTTLANGDYLVRIEGFRYTDFYPTDGVSNAINQGNYAYHEIPIKIAH